MKLWWLAARDKLEPPFHFFGVAHTVYVAAEDEPEARALAMAGTASKVWGDPEVTDCTEYDPQAPGVVAVVTD